MEEIPDDPLTNHVDRRAPAATHYQRWIQAGKPWEKHLVPEDELKQAAQDARVRYCADSTYLEFVLTSLWARFSKSRASALVWKILSLSAAVAVLVLLLKPDLISGFGMLGPTKVEQLEEERDDLRAEVEQSEAEETRLAEELGHVKAQNTALGTALEESRENATELEKETRELGEDLTASLKSVGALEASVTDLNTNWGGAQEKLGEANREIGTSKQQIEALEGEKQTLQGDLRDAQGEKKQLASDLRAALGKVATLTGHYTILTRTSGERDQLASDLREALLEVTELTALSAKLSSACDGQKTELESDSKKHQTEIDDLKGQIADECKAKERQAMLVKLWTDLQTPTTEKGESPADLEVLEEMLGASALLTHADCRPLVEIILRSLPISIPSAYQPRSPSFHIDWAFLRRDRELVTIGSDGVVRLRDCAIADGIDLDSTQLGTSCQFAATDEEMQILAVADKEGKLRVFDLANGELVAIGSIQTTDRSGNAASMVVVSPDGTKLAALAAGAEGVVFVRLGDSGPFRESYRIQDRMSGFNEAIEAASFSPDGDFLVIAGSRHCFAIDNTSDSVFEFPHGAEAVSVYSDRRIALASKNHLWVWNAIKGRRDSLSHGFTRPIKSVCFLRSGHLVAHSKDEARVWRRDGTEWLETAVCRFAGVSESGTTDVPEMPLLVGILPRPKKDSEFLIYRDDGTAVLWDADTGSPRTYFRNKHNGGITKAYFASDGMSFTTTGSDGIVRAWMLEVEDDEVDRFLGSMRLTRR